ncbi:MAG: hypothetical protein PVH88_20710 [Ignavibacteria bacterium]|jgi:hypothetical protein
MERYNYNNKPAPKFVRIIIYVIGGLALAAIFALIFGYFVMHLWNWLMPEIFKLPTINYWQAVGLALLTRLLFGTLGGHEDSRKDKFDHKFTKKMPPFLRKFPPPFDECKKWRYYDEYWEEEGKQSFEEFAKRKSTEDEQN